MKKLFNKFKLELMCPPRIRLSLEATYFSFSYYFVCYLIVPPPPPQSGNFKYHRKKVGIVWIQLVLIHSIYNLLSCPLSGSVGGGGVVIDQTGGMIQINLCHRKTPAIGSFLLKKTLLTTWMTIHNSLN